MNLTRWERFIFRLMPNILLKRILWRVKKYRFFKQTANTQTPITFNMWYNQKVLGHHAATYWPVHPTSHVGNFKNIYCGVETSPGYSPGNYIQAIGKIYIGDYTQIAPNVGIISANHSLEDNRKHEPKEVKIGRYCWLGMGSIVLPGVVLGDYTVVGAGAVVTKSFPRGYCVLAGNPAKIIKHLQPDNCVLHKSNFEYNGYIPAKKFEEYRQRNLNV